MADTRALAVLDDALLEELADLVDDKEARDLPRLPMLKINYDSESKYPVGAWVLGQKKDDKGDITEEGELIENIVVLTTRFRYSYYDQDDPKKSVATMFFGSGEKPADLEECKAKVPTGEKLKFQVVVFGCALTKDGRFIDFMSYIGGANYQPFMDFFTKKLTIGRFAKGPAPIPPFTFMVKLSPTRKERNKGVTYYVGEYELGIQLTKEQRDIFAEKREGVRSYIDMMNDKAKATGGGDSAPVAASVSAEDFKSRVSGSAAPTGSSTPKGGVIDAEYETVEHPAAPVAAAPVAAAPVVPESGGAEFDIEKAVAAALAEK